MADLIDRLAFHEEVTGRPKIRAHQFTGLMRLYAAGAVTGAEVKQDWDLQGAELVQADLIATAIDATGGALNKLILAMKLEAIAYLLEDDNDTVYHSAPGVINKARVAADLGI